MLYRSALSLLLPLFLLVGVSLATARAFADSPPDAGVTLEPMPAPVALSGSTATPPVLPPVALPTSAPAGGLGDALAAAGEIQRDVAAIKAANAAGDKVLRAVKLAGLLALLVKLAIHLLDWIVRLRPEAKAWIPLATALGGVVVALLERYANGGSWIEAVIVAGGSPGAVYLDQIFGTAINKLRPAAASTGPALVLLLALGCAASGCAGAYDTLHAAAAAGDEAIAGFRAYDAAHKREILAAHPECKAAPSPDVCRRAALAPYESHRDPVLARIDVLAPSLGDAARIGKQADADRAVTLSLASRIAAMVADVERAIEQLRAIEAPAPDGGALADGGVR